VYGAVAVRAEDSDARQFQPVEQFLVWMPVWIVFAHRYNRNAGVNRFQKLRRCRILAAVVSNLQHIRTQYLFAVLYEHVSFCLLLRVPR